MTALCLCGAAPDPAIACDCGATFCGVNHRGEHRQGGCPMLSPDGTLSITKRAKSLIDVTNLVADDPTVPPVRMAWHDPVPSLAEKARTELDPADRFLALTDLGNGVYEATWKPAPDPDDEGSWLVERPVYDAMTAVVEAARVVADRWRKAPHTTLGPDRYDDLIAAVDALDKEASDA